MFANNIVINNVSKYNSRLCVLRLSFEQSFVLFSAIWRIQGSSDLGGVSAVKAQPYFFFYFIFLNQHQLQPGCSPFTPMMAMELTAESHSIPLSDGNRMPLIGLGTYGDPRQVWHRERTL